MLLITKKRPTVNTEKDSSETFYLIMYILLFCQFCPFFCSPPSNSLKISFLYITLLTFDNDDMSSPKRDVYVSLLCILKCFSKSLVIRKQRETENLLTISCYRQIEVNVLSCRSCKWETQLSHRAQVVTAALCGG